MARCERCGAGRMSCLQGIVKFKDKKYICVRCLKELGHEHPIKDAYIFSLKTTDEILHPEEYAAKKRLESYSYESRKIGISVEQYTALQECGATDFEIKFFSRMCHLLDDEGCNPNKIVVASGSGHSLLLLLDGVVFVEFRGDKDVKWIRIQDGEKIRVGNSARLNSLVPQLVDAYRSA